jgi:acetyl esterase/lipase
MVSVLIDYRVKSRHKTTPYESVKDAKSAMRFLRSHANEYGIKSEEMVASGGSAGGHLAAAVSMLSGVNEDTDNLSVSSKAIAKILYNAFIDNGPMGFEHKRMGERYLEISLMHNITKGTPPTIFFLGDKDKLIPVATAYEFKEKMEAVGSRCDAFIYKDQEHGFFNKERQENDRCKLESTRETDVFLQFIDILKGKTTI